MNLTCDTKSDPFRKRRFLLAAALAAILAGCATAPLPPPASAPPASEAAEVVPQATEGKAEAAKTAETAEKTPQPLRVGVYADDGASGIGALEWLRIVEGSPEMKLTMLSGADVRGGALDKVDVFVMPGGNSKTEYGSLGTNGVEKMRAFIRGGGAYLGTCAGCCLLMDGPSQRARMIPWNSGGSVNSTLFLTVDVNDDGAKALGIPKGGHRMRYHGGPFMWPTTNRIDGADFALWGTYDAAASFKNGSSPHRKMHGAAAIVGGTYGKGRVFVTALHPEYFDDTRYIVAAAFKWLTGREVAFPVRQKKPGALAVGVLPGGKIAGGKVALAIDAADDMDLVPLDTDGILQGRLEHLDAVVACGGGISKSKRALDAVKAFAERGGRLYALESGKAVLPKGHGSVVPVAPEKVLAALREVK